MQNKPKDLKHGIKEGGKALGNSLVSGVQGLYEKPAEGFKKNNILGAAGGILSGAAGLFVKPVSGAVDFVSKTS